MNFDPIKVALLSHTIDYAGTFPPAKLPLFDAISTAASFRSKAKHPWLMAKSILFLKDILSLNHQKLFELGADGTPWLFAALPLDCIEEDFLKIKKYNDLNRPSPLPARIISYETKMLSVLSPQLDLVKIKEKLKSIHPILKQHSDITVFFELSFVGEDWKRLPEIGAVISEAINGQSVGLKIRTGGAKVPSSDELTQWIDTCRFNQFRFKATQGLHHPISTDPEFGFLNLLLALSLSYSSNHSFKKDEIKELLELKDKSEIKFKEKVIQCRFLASNISASEIL